MNMRTLLISLLLSLLLPMSSAQAEYNAPRILDGSSDEGARFYGVLCPDGKRTAIRSQKKEYGHFKPGEVCYKDNGQDKCSTGWNLDDAAVKACKAKKI